MSKQPEALRLADRLIDGNRWTSLSDDELDSVAAELRRLNAENVELLQALRDIVHGLEGARIWGGTGRVYNPLHPFKYLPLLDKARAAIAKVEGAKS